MILRMGDSPPTIIIMQDMRRLSEPIFATTTTHHELDLTFLDLAQQQQQQPSSAYYNEFAC